MMTSNAEDILDFMYTSLTPRVLAFKFSLEHVMGQNSEYPQRMIHFQTVRDNLTALGNIVGIDFSNCNSTVEVEAARETTRADNKKEKAVAVKLRRLKYAAEMDYLVDEALQMFKIMKEGLVTFKKVASADGIGTTEQRKVLPTIVTALIGSTLDAQLSGES